MVILRVGLLGAAMGGAYLLGRAPGPVAQWAGEVPAALRQSMFPALTTAENATEEFLPRRKYLTIQEALERLTAMAHDDYTGNQEQQEEDLDEVFFHVRPQDLGTLFKLLGGWAASAERDDIKFRLLQFLAPQNPLLAWTLSADLTDFAKRKEIMGSALEELSQDHPKDALLLLGKLSGGDLLELRDVVGFALERIAETDPAGAAALVTCIPPSAAREEALNLVALRWRDVFSNPPYPPGAEPQAALDWATSLSPPDSGILDEILVGLATSNPKLAADYVNKVGNANERRLILMNIFAAWTQDQDGVVTVAGSTQALEWLNQSVSGPSYLASIPAIFSMFGDANPAAAIALLDKVADPRALPIAINEIADRWGESDPKGALAWAVTLTETNGVSRNDTVTNIITQWAGEDPAAATAYLQSAGDPNLFAAAAPILTDGLARKDFPAALAFVQSLPAGTVHDDAMTNLVVADIQRSPDQAVSLLDEIPAGPAQVTATESMAATWVQEDPQALSLWINTLMPGDLRDAAVKEMVSAQAAKDPVAAFTWANTIANADLRAAQIETVLTTWSANNPTAAASAAQTANLSEVQRAALRQKLKGAVGAEK